MTITQEDILTEIDLESYVPCAVLVNNTCPNEAEWIQYLDCGARGNPSCTEHKIELDKYFAPYLMEYSVCILKHKHFVWELKWRRL